LLLGAPGTGKSTALCELAHELLLRAEQDPTHPLPVIVNLSSWATKTHGMRNEMIASEQRTPVV
ncbi:MAG TPA: hypothetical protein DDW25_06195, partial [Ktedonobacter sp.]|nr:hypothetical protein [Ktedonobacter sp.]